MANLELFKTVILSYLRDQVLPFHTVDARQSTDPDAFEVDLTVRVVFNARDLESFENGPRAAYKMINERLAEVIRSVLPARYRNRPNRADVMVAVREYLRALRKELK